VYFIFLTAFVTDNIKSCHHLVQQFDLKIISVFPLPNENLQETAVVVQLYDDLLCSLVIEILTHEPIHSAHV
jgi:hypothetical protein